MIRFILLGYLMAGVIASPLDAVHQKPLLAGDGEVHNALLAAIHEFTDPVEAVLAVHPELESSLAESRLLFVDNVTTWMTEGDKLRLRKAGKPFNDYTVVGVPPEIKPEERAVPHTPQLTHQNRIRPLYKEISTLRMNQTLRTLTSFHDRYYTSRTGLRSARWLHANIGEMPTIIARFEPPQLNSSSPLTIVSAHQDSANYENPLLPAPGAADDGSGTVSILEAFRILLRHGYVPERGPVEFHWYAAEEAGGLGSLDRAKYTKDLGLNVGAAMQFDMTAYVSRRNGAAEHIGLMATDSNPDLVMWVQDLAEEYSSLPTRVHVMGGGSSSDHASWTAFGYPAIGVDEADAKYAGGYPYIHSAQDRMDVNDENGYFSVDHMARFTELAIAFVVEQAGWGKYPEPL